jgi:hypothetical protein
MTAVASTSPLDDLLLELKGLVYARAILESRDAPLESIRVHDVEIDRIRHRLAEIVQVRTA